MPPVFTTPREVIDAVELPRRRPAAITVEIPHSTIEDNGMMDIDQDVAEFDLAPSSASSAGSGSFALGVEGGHGNLGQAGAGPIKGKAKVGRLGSRAPSGSSSSSSNNSAFNSPIRRRSTLRTNPSGSAFGPSSNKDTKVAEALKRRLRSTGLQSAPAGASALATTDDMEVDDVTSLPDGTVFVDPEAADVNMLGTAVTIGTRASDGNAAAGPSGIRASGTASPASEVDSLFDANLGLDVDMERDAEAVVEQLQAAVLDTINNTIDNMANNAAGPSRVRDGPGSTPDNAILVDDSMEDDSTLTRSGLRRQVAIKAGEVMTTLADAPTAKREDEGVVQVQEEAKVEEEEDEEDMCGCCYEEMGEVKREAVAAGKGGEEGKLAIYSCGQRACNTVFCMTCILEYCNRKIEMRQRIVTCPACTRPIDQDNLRAQAILYDPTVAEPLRRPPPPPHAMYTPWLERFMPATPIQPVDKSAIGDFIAYVAQNAIADRVSLTSQSIQRWHIVCCIAAWAEHFEMPRTDVLEFVNKVSENGLQVMPAAELEIVYAHPEWNAVQPALRSAAPFIPVILTRAECRAAEITDAALQEAAQNIGKFGSGDAAMHAMDRIAQAFHQAGLHENEIVLRRIATIVFSGNDIAARFLAKQKREYEKVVNDLLYHPVLIAARGNISVAAIVEYFGSTLASWTTARANKLNKDLPTTGPLSIVLNAVVAGYSIHPRFNPNINVPRHVVHAHLVAPITLANANGLVGRRNDLAQEINAIDRRLRDLGGVPVLPNDGRGRVMWLIRPGQVAGPGQGGQGIVPAAPPAAVAADHAVAARDARAAREDEAQVEANLDIQPPRLLRRHRPMRRADAPEPDDQRAGPADDREVQQFINGLPDRLRGMFADRPGALEDIVRRRLVPRGVPGHAMQQDIQAEGHQAGIQAVLGGAGAANFDRQRAFEGILRRHREIAAAAAARDVQDEPAHREGRGWAERARHAHARAAGQAVGPDQNAGPAANPAQAGLPIEVQRIIQRQTLALANIAQEYAGPRGPAPPAAPARRRRGARGDAAVDAEIAGPRDGLDVPQAIAAVLARRGAVARRDPEIGNDNIRDGRPGRERMGDLIVLAGELQARADEIDARGRRDQAAQRQQGRELAARFDGLRAMLREREEQERGGAGGAGPA